MNLSKTINLKLKQLRLYKIILVLITVSPILSYVSSDAVGANGMVVSSKIDASKIGVDILKKGGNAIDAAVAVAFALAVTHPSAGNLGGGGFMVINFHDGNSTTIDFRETAPLNSYASMFLDDDGNVIEGLSTLSALSTGVPGTVYGLGYVHQKYGTLEWNELVLPAMLLAKYGFSLDNHNVTLLNNDYLKSILSTNQYSKSIFTKKNKYELNEIFLQEDLSRTLHRIADFGFQEFYYGQTADLLIKCMSLGSCFK